MTTLVRACFGVLAGLMVAACPPQPPRPTPGPMSASTAPPGAVFAYSVAVNAVGPPRWTYTLKALFGPASPGDFSAVEIHSLCKISGQSVKVLLEVQGPAALGGAVGTNPPGFTISQPAPTDVRIDSKSAPTAGWSTLVISIEADCQNGAVHFIFDEGLTAATTPPRTVVGPVAGPQ